MRNKHVRLDVESVSFVERLYAPDTWPGQLEGRKVLVQMTKKVDAETGVVTYDTPAEAGEEQWGKEDEAQAGELYPFVDQGDELIGTLHERVTVPTQKNKDGVARYTIFDDQGQPWAVLAGVVLAAKLSGAKVGDRVRILFEGAKKTGTGNQMKQFRVWVKPGIKPVPETPESGKQS